jgi:hypothetical protein
MLAVPRVARDVPQANRPAGCFEPLPRARSIRPCGLQFPMPTKTRQQPRLHGELSEQYHDDITLAKSYLTYKQPLAYYVLSSDARGARGICKASPPQRLEGPQNKKRRSFQFMAPNSSNGNSSGLCKG